MTNVNIEWHDMKERAKPNRDYLIALGSPKAEFGYYGGNGEWFLYTPSSESGEELTPCTPYAWAEKPDAPAK